MPKTPPLVRLLQIGGVDHVISLQTEGMDGLTPVAEVPGLVSRPVLVFRVPDARPHVYLAGAARIATDADAVHVMLDPGFDPHHEIVLPPDSAAATSDVALQGAVTVVESKADRLRLVAEADRAGWLVVLDTFDPGWQARVDGQATPVVRANLTFRAIPIPAGRHEIDLAYRPTSVKVGLMLSGLALLVGLAVWIRPRARA
jgi:hypothetical protein